MTEDSIKKIIFASKSRSDASYKIFGYNNNSTLKRIDFYLEKFGHEYKKKPKYCKDCGKEIKSSNIFCNNSCSASFNNKRRVHTELTKEKISKSLKDKELFKNRMCAECGGTYTSKNRKKSKFCSDECKKKYMKGILIQAGRKSAESQNKRSKNEIYFANLCLKEFKKVRTNEVVFNGWDADVIIEDLKIAVLWNGNWHHKQIKEKHSLKQVQNRDRIKVEEIEKCGYKPYIINDYGKYNVKFVEKEFEKLKEVVRIHPILQK